MNAIYDYLITKQKIRQNMQQQGKVRPVFLDAVLYSNDKYVSVCPLEYGSVCPLSSLTFDVGSIRI